MSGLEIAGLVVGAFPLVIAALEHYHEAHKAIFRVDTEYRKTLEDIKDEQLLFRLVLEQLLSPLCASDNFSDGEIEAMLEDPDGAKWNQEMVADVANERLGRTHDRFMEIAKALQMTLSKLLSSLVNNKPQLQDRIKRKLEADVKSAKSSRSKLSMTAFQDFMKRQLLYRKEQLELGLGKPMREELVKEIHRDNKKLEKLLEKSDKISTLRAARTMPVSPKAVKALLQYSEHADQIHTLVHVAGARPQAATAVLAAPPTADESAPKKRRKVDFIGLRFSVEPSVPRPLSSPAASSRSRRNQTALKQCNKPAANMSEISKLCEAMSMCGMQSALIGSFSASRADKVYSVHSEPQQKIVGPAVSLQDILQGSNEPKPKRSDRFRIALAIASSHLQLRSTSWARRQWEAADVHFPKELSSEVLYDKPYVSASFAENLPPAGKVPKKSDRSFAFLGIMLLELLFGDRLEDHQLWEELGFSNQKTSAFHRLLVARQWADAAEDEGGQPFSAAIMWCLNESPTTLTCNTWRKDLADRVVLPLETCCDWFTSVP